MTEKLIKSLIETIKYRTIEDFVKATDIAYNSVKLKDISAINNLSREIIKSLEAGDLENRVNAFIEYSNRSQDLETESQSQKLDYGLYTDLRKKGLDYNQIKERFSDESFKKLRSFEAVYQKYVVKDIKNSKANPENGSVLTFEDYSEARELFSEEGMETAHKEIMKYYKLTDRLQIARFARDYDRQNKTKKEKIRVGPVSGKDILGNYSFQPQKTGIRVTVDGQGWIVTARKEYSD